MAVVPGQGMNYLFLLPRYRRLLVAYSSISCHKYVACSREIDILFLLCTYSDRVTPFARRQKKPSLPFSLSTVDGYGHQVKEW